MDDRRRQRNQGVVAALANLESDSRAGGASRDRGDPAGEGRAATRTCGTCSHCCTVLRVDEIAKPAGRNCIHQRGEAGCGIYDRRPPVCRGYRCLWLQGGLEDGERPDATGGIVDLESRGIGVQLSIREIRPGAFDASPQLDEIARRFREEMPVRVTDTADILNPDRAYRVLLAGGIEHRVEGEWSEVYRDGVFVERRRSGWSERMARRLEIWWRGRGLHRSGVDEPSGRDRNSPPDP